MRILRLAKDKTRRASFSSPWNSPYVWSGLSSRAKPFGTPKVVGQATRDCPLRKRKLQTAFENYTFGRLACEGTPPPFRTVFGELPGPPYLSPKVSRNKDLPPLGRRIMLQS